MNPPARVMSIAVLVTLFQVGVAWLDVTVSHFLVIVNKNFFGVNLVSLQSLALHCVPFCSCYNNLITCICDYQGLFQKTFWVIFLCCPSLWLLLYHTIKWLSTTILKYFSITFLYRCTTLIIQSFGNWTILPTATTTKVKHLFTLRKNTEIPYILPLWG